MYDFTLSMAVVDPPMVIYMGKDKHESEFFTSSGAPLPNTEPLTRDAQHDPYETTMIINPREIGHISGLLAIVHVCMLTLLIVLTIDEDLLKWGFPEDVWY